MAWSNLEAEIAEEFGNLEGCLGREIPMGLVRSEVDNELRRLGRHTEKRNRPREREMARRRLWTPDVKYRKILDKPSRRRATASSRGRKLAGARKSWRAHLSEEKAQRKAAMRARITRTTEFQKLTQSGPRLPDSP